MKRLMATALIAVFGILGTSMELAAQDKNKKLKMKSSKVRTVTTTTTVPVEEYRVEREIILPYAGYRREVIFQDTAEFDRIWVPGYLNDLDNWVPGHYELIQVR
jgi:hypothetical protein